MKGLRVIVCGGRDFDNRRYVWEVLDRMHAERPFRFLWHGNARGADSHADSWGWKQQNLSVTRVPAQWKKHGRRAGPIRNQNMLGQGIDLVIAFPGGRGTADMIRRAESAGVEVIRVPEPPKD